MIRRLGAVIVGVVLLAGCGASRPPGLGTFGAQEERVPVAASDVPAESVAPTVAPPAPPSPASPAVPAVPATTVPAPATTAPAATPSPALSLPPHPFPSQVAGGESLSADMQACEIIGTDFISLSPGPTLDAQVRADSGPLNASQRSQLESVLVHSDAVAKAIAREDSSSVDHNQAAQNTAYRRFLAGCPAF